MRTPYIVGLGIGLIVAVSIWYLAASQQPGSSSQNQSQAKMTFFVTSRNPGRGGDLGGLAGADAYCQALASSAGAGDRIWRAYLSTQATSNTLATNARDRIGNGPWHNFNGELIASSLEQLHNGNFITKQTALDEKGVAVNGRGDTPNWHDILTGSGPDGRTIATSTDVTCDNWTEDRRGGAMVGHHDRQGTSDTDAARSWNSSHLSRGCSLEELATTGSGGLFYCFAVAD